MSRRTAALRSVLRRTGRKRRRALRYEASSVTVRFGKHEFIAKKVSYEFSAVGVCDVAVSGIYTTPVLSTDVKLKVQI